jgi:hypothetical protein
MIKFRLAHLGLALAALGFTAATPMIGLSSAYAAEALRPEIGAPLQAAQALMKQGKNKEALAKLRDADKVGNKTAQESYLIERVRASAASSAGDNGTAAKAFEALIASGKLSPGEKANFSEGLIGIYMRAGDYSKANAAIQAQLKGGDNAKLRGYLIQNYYRTGNLSAAEAELKNVGRLSEDQLGLLANIQLKKGDKAGYVNTEQPPGGGRVPPQAGQQPDQEAERVHGNGPAGAAGQGAWRSGQDHRQGLQGRRAG